jgi:hypothetical protein
MMFLQEAASCRRQAQAFIGRPEGSFLLQVASAFEALATSQSVQQLTEANRRRQHGELPTADELLAG